MATTFKQLRLGETFIFASEREWWSSGMAKGPWRKRSERVYERAVRVAGSPSYRVGSVNVAVIRTGLEGNLL